MASELPISEQIQRLIRTSDAARGVLGSEIRELKHKLDVPGRLKDSLRSHPTGWLGGSVVAGMATSLLFRRKAKREKTEVKKKTLLGLIFTLAIAALRPFLKVWLTGQLKNYITAKFAGDEIPSRPQRHVTPFYK
ncbi:MAG: hypothetical protein EOP87_04815 [Verrucomicrobiaceae bacterium]|nr:MAG: hypothetical protein EOP87_04815 [Verrucomicrobiaceae bacterium]